MSFRKTKSFLSFPDNMKETLGSLLTIFLLVCHFLFQRVKRNILLKIMVFVKISFSNFLENEIGISVCVRDKVRQCGKNAIHQSIGTFDQNNYFIKLCFFYRFRILSKNFSAFFRQFLAASSRLRSASLRKNVYWKVCSGKNYNLYPPSTIFGNWTKVFGLLLEKLYLGFHNCTLRVHRITMKKKPLLKLYIFSLFLSR